MNANFIQQTATDYGMEEWEAVRIYRLSYDYEKEEHDLEEFYKLMEGEIADKGETA